MIGVLQTFASFVLVLGILVFVHELGHFVVAKWFGIGVPVFSLGFGPRLLGFRRGGTDYRISAIPLGGYVRLQGDESDDQRVGAPEEFLSRPRHQRFLVFIAGATFNVLLAFLVAWLMYGVYGKNEVLIPEAYPRVAEVTPDGTAARAGVQRGDEVLRIGGRDARDLQTQVEEIVLSPSTRKPVVVRRGGRELTLTIDTGSDPRYHLGFPGWLLVNASSEPPVIEHVEPGAPAAKVGLRTGDRVVGVDDRQGIDEIELRALLAASPGRPVTLAIARGTERLSVRLTPRNEDGRGKIGVNFRPSGLVHRDLGVGEAAREAWQWNVDLTRNLFTTLGKLFRSEISLRAFSGPIEIARVSREAVRTFESFLYLLAFISLQLGILNLLPIPVLDGGHLLILGIESVMRRDMSEKVKERAMQVGFVFLLAFFSVIIAFDVIKARF